MNRTTGIIAAACLIGCLGGTFLGSLAVGGKVASAVPTLAQGASSGVALPAGCLDNEMIKADGTTGEIQCEDSVTVDDNGQITSTGVIRTSSSMGTTQVYDYGTASVDALLNAAVGWTFDVPAGKSYFFQDANSTILTMTEDDTTTNQAHIVSTGGVEIAIANGVAPDATCTVGELFLDTDQTDDTNCTTTADNSLCLCTATDTWTALENN